MCENYVTGYHPNTVGSNFSTMVITPAKLQILYIFYIYIHNVTSLENNIITDFQEICWERLDCTFLAEDNGRAMGYLDATKRKIS